MDIEMAKRDLARRVEDEVYNFLADYQFDPAIDREGLVKIVTDHLNFSFVIAAAHGRIEA